MPTLKRPAAVELATDSRKKVAKSAPAKSVAFAKDAEHMLKAKEREPQPWDPIVQALQERSRLAPDVLGMIDEALPDTLGVLKDQRHPFQERVLDFVSGVLRSVEDGLLERLRDLTVKVERVDEDRGALLESTSIAKSALDARAEEHVKDRASFVACEEAVVAAKATLEAKRSDQVKGIEAIDNAVERRSTLQAVIVDVYEPLKAGTDTDPVKAVDNLIVTLTSLGFDAALLSSAQFSLAKAHGVRGSFDALVIEHLDKEIDQALKALQELDAHGSLNKNKLQSAVDVASTALHATKEARDNALIAESNSSVKLTDAKEVLSGVEQELVAFDRSMEESKRLLVTSNQELQSFREVVLAVFERMRSATSQEDASRSSSSLADATQVSDGQQVPTEGSTDIIEASPLAQVRESATNSSSGNDVPVVGSDVEGKLQLEDTC